MPCSRVWMRRTTKQPDQGGQGEVAPRGAADGELDRFEGRTPAPHGGVDFKGSEPLDQYYEVVEGWISVQAVDAGSTAIDHAGAGDLEGPESEGRFTTTS